MLPVTYHTGKEKRGPSEAVEKIEVTGCIPRPQISEADISREYSTSECRYKAKKSNFKNFIDVDLHIHRFVLATEATTYGCVTTSQS